MRRPRAPIQIVPKSVPAYRNGVGIAYIRVPKDVDRERFIEYCYRTGTVSILNEGAEFINDVKIDNNCLQWIEFPDTSEENGSVIVWINQPQHNKPLVIAVLTKNDEVESLQEKQFSLIKTSGNTSASISGRGDDGKIFINVEAEEEGGEIYITATNKSNTAKINVFVTGQMDVYVKGKVNIKTTEEVNIVGKKTVNVDGEKINHGKGEEPMLKGKSTLDFLEKLLNILGKDSAGPYPLLGNAQYIQLIQELEQLKSTQSFLD